MLVLTRKVDESISLKNNITGEEIVITVCRLNGKTARLGIQAERNWEIVRSELPPLPAAAESTTDTANQRDT